MKKTAKSAKAGLKAPNPFPPNSLSTSVSVFFDNAEKIPTKFLASCLPSNSLTE